MTRHALLLAAGLTAFAAPALAEHGPYHQQNRNHAQQSPCKLGQGAQPSPCSGPVQIVSQVQTDGPVMRGEPRADYYETAPRPQAHSHMGAYQQQGYASSNSTYSSSQRSYGSVDTGARNVQFVHANPVRPPEGVYEERPRLQRGGCVAPAVAAPPPCSGEWIFVPYEQAPQPVVYAPQPRPVTGIPASFFSGGMSYGVGYPMTIGYGGGGSYYSGGGSRFSGVRERSPTPLVPPPMKHRSPPPPPPPPVHKPPCGHCH